MKNDDDAKTLIGLIVPPAHALVPPEGPALYGTRPVGFVARGLGLDAMAPESFDKVVGRILDLACELRDAGAAAVSLMGTSLSFYRGADFTDELRDRMRDATGVPCTTMSHAIVSSIERLGMRRPAVATAYVEPLNRRMVAFLASRGIDIVHIDGLSILGVDAVAGVTEPMLFELARRVLAAAPRADGLVVSCGGLRTLGLHVPLEREFGIPVTSSSPAGFWDALNAAGLDPRSRGHGRLFALEPAATNPPQHA